MAASRAKATTSSVTPTASSAQPASPSGGSSEEAILARSATAWRPGSRARPARKRPAISAGSGPRGAPSPGAREEGREALEAGRERAGELGEVLADAARRGGGGGGARGGAAGFVLLGGEEGVGDGAREPRHCRRRGRRRRQGSGRLGAVGKVGGHLVACALSLSGGPGSWGDYFGRQKGT
jgi:hypothetical protein